MNKKVKQKEKSKPLSDVFKDDDGEAIVLNDIVLGDGLPLPINPQIHIESSGFDPSTGMVKYLEPSHNIDYEHSESINYYAYSPDLFRIINRVFSDYSITKIKPLSIKMALSQSFNMCGNLVTRSYYENFELLLREKMDLLTTTL